MNQYHIKTYGCQMNVSDSERIASVLESIGFKKAEKQSSADLIVVVACSVRQSAMDRIYGKSVQWQKRRKQGKLKTILTGCILLHDKKKLKNRFDLILNINDLSQWSKKLSTLTSKTQSAISNQQSAISNYLCIPPKHKNKITAFVPIMNGCNNFCSYCVVPYTRGREYSRPADEIIDEIRNLIKENCKEIILIGQNVNSYKSQIANHKSQTNFKSQISNSPASPSEAGRAKQDIVSFPKLLQTINNIPGNFWIRFITSHPKDMSDELLNAMAKCEKVCEHIHLPAQSGNNEILKKMNRGYTIKHYKNLIRAIRKKLANVAVSTDIIVGFPGETYQQFQDTVKLFANTKYDMAYISQYSPRPETAAYKLKDDVLKEEKKRREKVLTKILEKTALENNKKYIGKVVDVLVNELRIKNQESRILLGKTRSFKTVKFQSKKDLTGQFVKIKITQADAWGLKGRLIS